MTAYNLAVVFAPTLMRSPTEELSLVKDLPMQKHFVEYIICKHDILFAQWDLSVYVSCSLYTFYVLMPSYITPVRYIV